MSPLKNAPVPFHRAFRSIFPSLSASVSLHRSRRGPRWSFPPDTRKLRFCRRVTGCHRADSRSIKADWLLLGQVASFFTAVSLSWEGEEREREKEGLKSMRHVKRKLARSFSIVTRHTPRSPFVCVFRRDTRIMGHFEYVMDGFFWLFFLSFFHHGGLMER